MFGFTNQDRWEFGIGDPTIMGWLTVAAYWLAALLCWRVGRMLVHSNDSSPARSHRNRSITFWIVCGVFLAFLGVNKQLDLQTWFTLTAKQLAINQGWYEQRRIFQALFIAAVAAVSIAGFLLMMWLARGAGAYTRLALFGAVFLGCFVLIRATSFHRVDELIGFPLGGFKMNWLLELGGIACMGIAAWKAATSKTGCALRP